MRYLPFRLNILVSDPSPPLLRVQFLVISSFSRHLKVCSSPSHLFELDWKGDWRRYLVHYRRCRVGPIEKSCQGVETGRFVRMLGRGELPALFLKLHKGVSKLGSANTSNPGTHVPAEGDCVTTWGDLDVPIRRKLVSSAQRDVRLADCPYT